MNVWRVVSDMIDATEDLDEKIRFLSGFVAAFRDQIHTDILLKPSNNNGPPIPAHKALMVTLSPSLSTLDMNNFKDFSVRWSNFGVR